jgi:hypothetical protein
VGRQVQLRLTTPVEIAGQSEVSWLPPCQHRPKSEVNKLVYQTNTIGQSQYIHISHPNHLSWSIHSYITPKSFVKVNTFIYHTQIISQHHLVHISNPKTLIKVNIFIYQTNIIGQYQAHT